MTEPSSILSVNLDIPIQDCCNGEYYRKELIRFVRYEILILIPLVLLIILDLILAGKCIQAYRLFKTNEGSKKVNVFEEVFRLKVYVLILGLLITISYIVVLQGYMQLDILNMFLHVFDHLGLLFG